MRVFFVAQDLPAAGHTTAGAVTVLVREALAVLRAEGHEVVLQPLLVGDRAPVPTDEEAAALRWAAGQGIETLEPLHASDAVAVGATRARLARRAASSDPGLFYPAYALREEVARRAGASGADLALHLWSAAALAACAAVEQPVFAYYGNPDHKPIRARLRHPELFGIPHGSARERASLALRRAANDGLRRANLRLMRTCAFAGNVCALDASWFAGHGHPNAFYVPNMWPEQQPAAADEDVEVVGSIGALGATGNTFGLEFLGREVAPALEARVGPRLRIDVCGGGRPTAAVAAALDRPSIRLRGFVDDIDAVIAGAKVFLMANTNHPDFVVGHTRVLHAWSLGTCVVAHRNIALAMPEIVHGENALLGGSGEELAELTAEALRDGDLRTRIGEAGRERYRGDFTPEVVVRRVLAHVRRD